MLTVIVPERDGQRPPAWTAERVESDTALGVRVRHGGKTTLVAFRKAEQGTATLATLQFETSAAVETSTR
jgi:hypothetical protein